MEREFAVVVLDVNPVQTERVEVGIESQIRAHALHDGDGAALAVADTTRPEMSPIPPQHRVDEGMAHVTEQLAVVGQARSELERQREHELPQWRCAGKHVLDEIRGGLGHASSEARWAKSQASTRERHDDALGAL
jgi:hypothetical protein